VEGPRAHGVAQRRLGEESRAVVCVLHVGDGDGRVVNPVVHHGVHRHRHAVLCQHLCRVWTFYSSSCFIFLRVIMSCFFQRTSELFCTDRGSRDSYFIRIPFELDFSNHDTRPLNARTLLLVQLFTQNIQNLSIIILERNFKLLCFLNAHFKSFNY
jgi:hypothetical protein